MCHRGPRKDANAAVGAGPRRVSSDRASRRAVTRRARTRGDTRRAPATLLVSSIVVSSFDSTFAAAIDAAAVQAWLWDLASGRVQWSPGLERLLGLAPGAFGGTFDAY